MIIASATAAALVAGQIGAKASRDTLFLSNYPAADLPRVMLVAALFSLIASVLFAGLLRRQGPRLVIPALLVLSALLWAGEWSLYASQPRLVAELIFLHLATFGATVISGFWSVVNERFNPHEAKQVVARIVAGSTLGGAVGGLLTERTASVFGAPATLLLLALFSLGAAAGVWWLGGGEAPVVRADDPAVPPAPIGKTHSQRGYFTNLAILSLLVATLSALVAFASGDERQISLLLGRRQLDPAIAPLVIRRLGNARHRPAARDYLLRFAAPLSGQLGDALLDRELPLETRLNCAAILTEAAPGRAIPALLAALEEPVFHLRAASACTLLELRRREQLPPEVGRRVLELVPRHLPGGALWSAVAPPALATEPGGGGPALEALLPGQADARLRLVFGLLATAHRPEPMIQAFRALASGEARLGGTALEYLDNVLSEELRKALTPLVSGPARLIGSSLAPPQEIKEIERSQSALRRSELSEPSRRPAKIRLSRSRLGPNRAER